MNARSPWYGLLAGMIHCVLGSLAAGLLGALVLGALVMLVNRAAGASPTDADAAAQGVDGGTLWLHGAGGLREAPAVDTDVHISVSGLVARARVRQIFHNPGADWVEGVYVFPLPEDAAVDHLRMQVGEREILGRIKERVQARKTYEQARQQGRKASLVEQERPNVFTTSVANIGPDEQVTVQIEYQQVLRYEQGRFHLRFPMVVGPRYIPGSARITGFEGTGWAANTDQVPDAARVTPPVTAPGGEPRNSVSLEVELAAGMPLAGIESSYHPVDVSESGGVHRITLDAGQVPADRDFELVWEPQLRDAPRAALFTEKTPEAEYALLMLVPPLAGAGAEGRLSRELVLVIDTSGSMHGESIAQARAAVIHALERLGPGDRFNVIQFNSASETLYAAPAPADAAHVREARRYVAALEANGGTEMAPAITAALAGQGRESGALRQVVFLTDGAVGNEQQLFGLIEQHLGRSRLFTVGIGSAPNSHFMRRAARLGRGAFTYIGKSAEVGERMQELLRKLESPVMRDIALSWADGQAVSPAPGVIPDLYAGEPVVVTLRADRLPSSLGVSGKLASRAWRSELTLAGGARGEGLGKLWARRRIETLMDGLSTGVEAEQVRSQIVDLALAHHLVSRYTSLVAVDVTPSRPAEKRLGKRAVPVNLPHGWSYEHVFGALPQTGTPTLLHLLLGAVSLMAAGLLGWRRRSGP